MSTTAVLACRTTPSTLSPFVGRIDELRTLQERLAFAGAVVTCWGTAGVGKTRLVLELLERVPTSAVFVSLMGCSDELSVISALANELGVALLHVTDPLGAVAARLRSAESPAIVVLDNVEHVATHVPTILDRLRASAPLVRWLLTSTVALGLPGESVIELRPLTSDAALTLLRYRAESFALVAAAGDALELGAVARAVDCVPLALELIAPTVALLGVRSALKLIGERCSPRLVAESSLGRAIHTSWKLLSESEQSMLLALWPYRGQFTEDDACAIEGNSDRAQRVLEELVRKAFVVRSDENARTAFRLLWSVRAFVESVSIERAAAGAAKEAHAMRCCFQAEAFATALRGPDPASALAALRGMREDLVAAAEVGPFEQRVRILSCIESLLEIDGPLGQLVGLCDAVLRSAPALSEGASAVSHDRAQVEAIRCHAQRRAGDHDGAARSARALLATCVSRPARSAARVIAYEVLGHVALAQGDLTRSLDALTKLEVEVDDADVAQRLRANMLRASYATALGRHDDAISVLERALWLAKGARWARQVVRLSLTLGSAYVERGSIAEAQFMLDQAQRAMGEGASGPFAYSVDVLQGMIAHANGELSVARRCYERAGRTAAMLGLPWLEAVQEGYACFTRLERGEFDAVIAAMPAVVDRLRSAGEHRNQSLFLALLAVAHAGLGQSQLARSTVARSRDVIAEHSTADDQDVLARLSYCVDSLLVRDSGIRVAPPQFNDAQSSDAIVAARMIDRLLNSSVMSSGVRHSTLVIGPSYQWMQPPHGAASSLDAKPMLRALLRLLVENRRRDVEGVVTLGDIRAALWPGSRLSDSVAGNRARVAMTSLRKLGLRGLLEHRGLGWRLTIDVLVMD